MSLKWKVSGIPESPGEGWRYTGEIRPAHHGDDHYDILTGRVQHWCPKHPSASIYPIVERIKPKRLVLEQMLDPDDIRASDIVRTEDGRVYSVGRATDSQLTKEQCREGQIWRIVEEEEEE